MGHDFGLYWLKQSVTDGKRTWTKEDIDTSFSQVHTLHLADFDGDGQKEFVTGKRIYAHASEPGATAERASSSLRSIAQMASGNARPSTWKTGSGCPYQSELRDAQKDFSPGSAGTGLQMAIQDMDNDGDLDIVAPGKSGLYWFEI